jgi:hypothetical protein
MTNTKEEKMKNLRVPLVVMTIAFIGLTGCCNLPGLAGAPRVSQPQPAASPPSVSPDGPQITFTSDHTTIKPGECTTLQWNVQSTGEAVVELDAKRVNRSGEQQVCPLETTTYVLHVDAGSIVRRPEIVIVVARSGESPVAPKPPTPVAAATQSPTQPAARSPVPSSIPPSASPTARPSVGALNSNPPSKLIKLIFIHHSTGENWLADDNGGLGIALRDNNYFVSDTNYDWGPDSIGSTTDIGHWYTWFRGSQSATYLRALYAESQQHAEYSRLTTNPGGENQIVLFKSCFPNSYLQGKPNDLPTTGSNPLRGQEAGEQMTVANVKGIYNDILQYFATRQDKLFVAITAPPQARNETDPTAAANARAFNNWLVKEWLKGYSHKNVFVFDFYNVLTSNGGNVNTNDAGRETGNHHRLWKGAVQHIQTVNNDFSAYPSAPEDSHPTAAGGKKATGEFVPLLNVAMHCWLGDGGCPPR